MKRTLNDSYFDLDIILGEISQKNPVGLGIIYFFYQSKYQVQQQHINKSEKKILLAFFHNLSLAFGSVLALLLDQTWGGNRVVNMRWEWPSFKLPTRSKGRRRRIGITWNIDQIVKIAANNFVIYYIYFLLRRVV